MKLDKTCSIPVAAAICVASLAIWLCWESKSDPLAQGEESESDPLAQGEELESDPLAQGEVSAHIPDHREVQWPHDAQEPVNIKPVPVHVRQDQASRVVQLLHEGTPAVIDVKEWAERAVVDLRLEDIAESSLKLNLTQLIYQDYARKEIPQATAARFSKRLRHSWAKVPHSYFAYTPERHDSNLIRPRCSYHWRNASWAAALFTAVDLWLLRKMFPGYSRLPPPYPFARPFRNRYPAAMFWGASVGSLHYDYQDNALIQLRGTKQVIIYPPNVTKAILNGSSGEDRLSPAWFEIGDFLCRPTISKRPELEAAAQQVILEPGMGLLIPAGALHAPRALTHDSMSVNSYLFGRAGPNQYIEALDAPGYKEFKKEHNL